QVVLEGDVGRDERGGETSGGEPRGRVAGTHLDELDALDRGAGIGAPERADRVAGVVEEADDLVAQAPARGQADAGHRARPSSTATTSDHGTPDRTSPTIRW